MTFEEFELLPEHLGKQELLRGELIELPPPKKHHNLIADAFFLALVEAITKMRAEGSHPPVGNAHREMGYRVSRKPDSWLIPDVSISHPISPATYISKARRSSRSKLSPRLTAPNRSRPR